MNSPVGIIGLGCRYPDARNPRELWENILARRQSFRRIPDVRLPLSEYGDSNKATPDKTYAERAAVIDGFQFDWARRRIPKQVFEQTDITHWLALDVALQALADAGYEPAELPRDRTGVIVGNTLTGEQQRAYVLRGRWPFVRKTIRAAGIKKGLLGTDLEELVAETEEIYKSYFPAPNEDTLAGALSNTIAGRICNYMDLRGGGYTVDGACASSLLSVATAATALCAGDVDVALAGGVDISLDAFELVGFARVGALSDSEMKVYDRAANGFLPGEGCGFIVMKRLDDARDHGDYIYAVLNGWGISSDGKGGITAPTADGQGLALQRAYDRAGYSAHALDFVEGHGTGTAVGDPVELRAISSTIDSFGEATPHRCGVTSFKSLVGHTKAAAGIGGLLKAIAGVNRRMIPPTAGCDNPHEVFTSDARNLYPVRTGAQREPSSTLTAGVSAMGFGGINSHITITSGDPPSQDLAPSIDERALLASKQETELYVLAGESLTAIAGQATTLLETVQGMSVGEMPDLAVELARKISVGALARAAIVASSPEDLHKRLQTLIAAAAKADPIQGHAFDTPDRCVMLTKGITSPRVGYLFPGQGSQRLNMARTLVERFDWARNLVKNADCWLEEIGVNPVSPFMFRDTDQDLDGSRQKQWMRELTQTQVAQPAICLASLLWLRFTERLGLRPFAVGGHSLGELTAFHAAGAMDEKSVMQLAGLRGKLMGEVQVQGSMASLSCSTEKARELLSRIDGYVVLANMNSPTQTVVSGDAQAVTEAVALAAKVGIHARELPVSAAFHSAHFNDAVSKLRDATLLRTTTSPTAAKLYSSMTGAILEGEIALADHFGKQLVQPVDFQSVAELAAAECDVLVEVGPGAVLSGLSNETAGIGGTLCLPVESKAGRDRDLNTALAYLFTRGADVDFAGLWDRRLIRRFRSAKELSFIENPCEKDAIIAGMKQAVASSGLDAQASVQPNQRTELTRGPLVTAVRPKPPESGLDRHDSVKPRTSSVPAYVNVRAVLLDAIHKQTGFPVDMLTEDLRMIDDLHMDSIKTVQVVVDVAVALGYAGDFDPAEIANATLGDIVQQLEARIAAARQGRSGSVSQSRAAEIGGRYPGWTRNFVMRWHDAPLPNAPEDFWKSRSVCILDDGSKIAANLGEVTRLRGAQVNAIPISATADIGSSLVVAVLSDEAMGSQSEDRLRNVTERLASIAPGLPLSTGSDSLQTFVFLQSRAAQSEYLDWGYEGFVAALHLERRNLRFRVLTIDEAVNTDEVCDAIAREVQTDLHYDSARYFGKIRRITGPEILPRSALTRRSKQLDAGDVVLVTGGARGITAECALGLARETGAHMVLVGSSPFPSDASDSPNSAEIKRTLERFASEGCSAEYRQCDLRNLGEVANLIAAVRRRSGRVSAVIHGAAINRPRRAHRVTAEDAREEIGPKLVGALNLFDALRDDPPAIFCAFTSVIGVTGMPNNTWYAFANQALDRSLGMFASCHPETDAVSMAFSLWGEIGMGVNLGSVESLGSLGTDAIPTEEGVQRFLDLFTQESLDRQVIITGRLGGIDTWRPEFPLFPKGARFLEDVRFFQPGVELIARSHLHLDRDSYLLDHRYKGSYLFPTVFGLEAMAQSVAYVLKRCELPKLSIRDVKLHRPLLVDPARGLTIEVVARVAEDDSEVTAVDVAVRSEQTGFASDHFTARFVLGSRSDLASESELPASAASTNIDPARDLYGPILFQGPRFQRIVRVRTLDSGHCSFDANETPEGAFVLGDPYVRDALLQSLQLCTLPDRCLPVQIRRIDICDPNRAESGIRSCIAQIDDRTDEAYVGSVACSSLDGQPLEILVDYHAKIIERQPLWPTPQELAERGTTTDHGASAAFVEGGDWDGGAHYRDVVAYGPQKQTAFFLRFPLTAQECQGPHGAVSFTNYYRWAGKTRELGTINTPGAYSKLIDMLASQELTAATNSFETRILGLPRPNDMIEVRYWAENVTRQDADAIYEWWRIPFPPGSESCEMIAWSRMKTSAVKVLNHGHVMSSEWPEFFFQFLSSMGPRTKDPTPEPVLLHDMGEQLFSGEGRALRQPAQEYVVQTTLEDGNVVGNVYFANYGIWQGRARDRLLYRVSPSLFNPTTTRSMVHCVETNTYHLREAMPFDEISVRTYISAVYERGLRLEFDFTRMAEGVPSCKLARGFHEAIWVPVGYGIAPRPTSWPVEVRETLLALAEEQLASQAAS